MKRILSALLLCFTSYCASAQLLDTLKWNEYVDASLGIIPAGDGFYGIISLSAGATNKGYKSKYSIGLAGTSIMSNYETSGFGIGLELRYTPNRWLLIKGQVGRILTALDSYESGQSNSYLPSESSPIFWHGMVAIRFLDIMFAGISTMQTGEIAYATGNNPTRFYRTKLKATIWQLGLSFPSLPRKSKK